MTACNLEFTIGPLSAIPLGEGRTFSVAGEEVAIFHTRTGQVLAVQANCPHKGGPLSDGLVGGSTVICPLHSWKFDLASGEQVAGSCRLKTYAVRLDDEKRIVLTIQVLEYQDSTV
jgi:nitrite reductase (NADH) small subunit